MEQNNVTDSANSMEVKAETVFTDAQKEKLQLSPEQQKLMDDKIHEITKKAYERAEKRVDELTQKRMKEFEEAERLKNMTEEQKQVELLKKYEAELAEYKRKDLVTQYKLELSNEGLPAELANYFPADNAEQAKAAIDYFKSFKSGIVGEYEKRIADLEAQLKAAQMRSPAPKAAGATIQPQRQTSQAMVDVFNQLKKINN